MISNEFLTMFMMDFFNFNVQSFGTYGENRFDDAFQKFTQMRQLKKIRAIKSASNIFIYLQFCFLFYTAIKSTLDSQREISTVLDDNEPLLENTCICMISKDKFVTLSF